MAVILCGAVTNRLQDRHLTRFFAGVMLFLRTFGGLSLENGGRPIIGAAGQPRRLAVLAVLAVANDAGISREQLCALFWPDSDGERARGALKQALHALRRDVRAPDLVLGTSGLRLNSAVITSDVGAFGHALCKGDLTAAVAHYTGPFLDRVQLRGESEFERWADENRRVFATQYVAALETLSVAATARRDYADAVHWARMLNAADAFNTRAALLFVNALDAAGERASAIRHGELHVTLLRNELEVEPSVELTQTLARLREPPPPRPRVESAPKVPEPPANPPLGNPDVIPPRRRHSAVVGAAALVVAAIVFIALRIAPRAGATEQERDERLLVMPFETGSGRGGDSLSEIVTSLLATALTGAPHLKLVERAVVTIAPQGVSADQQAAALSKHLDAGRFARGVVVLEGSHVSLRATLHDSRAPTSTLFSVEAEGSADSLVSVTNRLAAEFLAAQYPAIHRSLVQAAARSTPSLDAFKAYLAGDDAMDKKRYDAALMAYQRAVAIDSAFALAYYQLSIAADWAPNDAVRDAADRAVRTSGHLGEHERVLIAALRAWRRFDFDEAERLYRRVTLNWSNDVEAHYQLAEVLFHGNPVRGRSFLESEAEFMQVLAADPRHDEARLHLARIAAWTGDAHRADSLLRLVIASTPDSAALELRTFRAAAVHDRAEFTRLAAEFENLDDRVVITSCTRVAVWTHDLDGAEHLCRMLTSPRRSPVSRAVGRQYLAQLAMAGGDRVRARQQLAQMPDVSRLRGLVVRAWMETLPGIPLDGPAVRDVREALMRADTCADQATLDRLQWLTHGQGSQRDFFLALLNRAIGDGAASHVTHVLHQAGAAPVDTLKVSYVHALSARAALEDGRLADAVSLSVAKDPGIGIDELSDVSNRFVHATAFGATGHRQDALDGYASFDGAYIFDLVLAAPAHLRRAAIFERDGLVADARREYDVALALWQHPDPALQPVWQAARQRRAALAPQ